MSLVQYELHDEIAIVRLANPPLNVMSAQMLQEIDEYVKMVEADETVFSLIVTGEGERAFVAGADIKEFPQYWESGLAHQKAIEFDTVLQRIHKLSKPSIAALNGVTFGGGCELALACDFRIAEDHVLIGLPEIKLGIFPGAGGTQRLPRLIGESRAKYMIMTGEPVDAAEAQKIGLVNQVVPRGQAQSAALLFANVLKQRSLAALRLAKRAIDEGLELSLEAGLQLEAKLFGEVFQTADSRIGIEAFIAKRPAEFKHR